MVDLDYIVTIDTKNPKIDGGYRVKEVQDLVRCKYCKYWKNGYLNYDVHPWLPCMEINTKPDWFCADGIHKEGWRSVNDS